MNDEFAKSLIGLLGFVWIALIAGVASVLQQTVIFKSRQFSWTFAASEIFISGVAGMIMYFICEASQVTPMVEAACIGVAGNMGSKFLFATHKIVCNYLHCDKNKGRNSDEGQ